MLRIATFLLFCLSVLSAPAALAQPKCDRGSAKKPHLEAGVWTLPGGVMPHRKAYVLDSCWQNSSRREGLADSDGKLLVPAIYNRVVPLSATVVAVQPAIAVKAFYQEREPWRLYVIGKGEVGPSPWKFIWDPEWNGERTAIGWNGAYEGGAAEYFVISGDPDNPVPIRNLGGSARTAGEPTIEHNQGMLIVHFTAADGAAVSRILDFRGKPVSPVLGAIERWDTYAPLWAHEFKDPNYPAKNRAIAVDYLSIVMTADHPVLPYRKLYVPIAPGGQPLPLPNGVIGVVPLKFLGAPNNDNVTLGWGLIEDGNGGLKIRAAFGTLADVIARAPSLPSYTGLARFNQSMTDRNGFIRDVFAYRKAGESQWRILDAMQWITAPSDGDPVTGRDAREAYANYVANRMAFQRNAVAEYERERAAGAARAAVELEGRHKEVLAGDYCNWYHQGSPMLATKTIDHILANCKITTDAFFNFARSLGANPELLAKAEYSYWEARGRYAVPIPPAPPGSFTSPNWEAWGNAIIQSAKDNTDTFIRDQRREYYKNMEAWNRGRQNWCC